MNRNLRLGGVSYQVLSCLQESGGTRWLLVRGPDGREGLLEHWDEAPSLPQAEQLKHRFLLTCQEACQDAPFQQSFGPTPAWHLQMLEGKPLLELWREQDFRGRQAIRAALEQVEGNRAWFPEAVTWRDGRPCVPLTLHGPVGSHHGLLENLDRLTAPLEPGQARSLPQPDLAGMGPLPLHGRVRETTWLKTVMVGLTASLPMERIVILQGEPGLGHRELCRWAAAVAQSEGIWVHSLQSIQDTQEDPLGALLGQLLQGIEADFYAAHPEATRRFARRVPAFQFMRGDRPAARPPESVTPEEMSAALEAMAYAQQLHPRLILAPDLGSAPAPVLSLLRDVCLRSPLGWILPVSTSHPGSTLKVLLGALQQAQPTTTLQLSRLREEDMTSLAASRLHPHRLSSEDLTTLTEGSLGNPGFLRDILEHCQQEGRLTWQNGAWVCPAPPLSLPQAHQDRAEQLLAGRIARLRPPSLLALRLLALREAPLAVETLGHAMGLAGDPLETALEPLFHQQILQAGQGRLRFSDRRLPGLILKEVAPEEIHRLTRTLLKALDHEGATTLPPVQLLARVMEPAAVLERVMCTLDRHTPTPREAERFVHRAMALEPTPLQQAQLWSFLAEAWSQRATHQAPAEAGGSAQHRVLDALRRAQAALVEAPSGDRETLDLCAQVIRRRAEKELDLGLVSEARQTLQLAAHVLADHPMHPEQARLCSALARLHVVDGYLVKALKTCEEGLQHLQGREGADITSHRIQLLMGAGQALQHRGQLAQAGRTLEGVQRLLQQSPDPLQEVETALTLAELRLFQGRIEQTQRLLREGLDLSRREGLALPGARCHLAIGILRCLEGNLSVAHDHLDKAVERLRTLGDHAGSTSGALWKARALAQSGDRIESELYMVRALGSSPAPSTPLERGEREMLEAEVALLNGDSPGAMRLFRHAASTFEAAGLQLREWLVRLRRLQALAALPGSVSEAWNELEHLKALVESSGSPLLELEWNQAHALLLEALPDRDVHALSILQAWDGVLVLSRTLGWHGVSLRACVASAEVLLERGEPLGARSRLQEAGTCLHILWSRMPETAGPVYLARPELQRFSRVSAAAGIPFVLPERADPLADWTPTQVFLGVSSEEP